MLSENICDAELFDLQCVEILLKCAVASLETKAEDGPLSIANIIEVVKLQCDLAVRQALNDELGMLV